MTNKTDATTIEVIKQIAKYLYENDYVSTEFYEDEDDMGHKQERVEVGVVFEDEVIQDIFAGEVETLALEHSQSVKEFDEAKRWALSS